MLQFFFRFTLRRLSSFLDLNSACSQFVPHFYYLIPHFGQSVPDLLPACSTGRRGAAEMNEMSRSVFGQNDTT